MRIRDTLAILLTFFGVTLLTLLYMQGAATYQRYQSAAAQRSVDQTSDDLLSAIIGLQNDRAHLAELSSPTSAGATPEGLVLAPVGALQRAARDLQESGNATLRDLGAGVGRQQALLVFFREELAQAMATGDANAIWAQGFTGIETIYLIKQRLMTLRHAVLAEGGIGTATGGLHMFRNHVLSLNHSLQQDRVLTFRELEYGPVAGSDILRLIEDRTRTLQAFDSAFIDLVPVFDAAVIELAGDLSEFLRASYVPAKSRLLRAMNAGQDIAALQTAWTDAGNEASLMIREVLASVSDLSRSRLTEDEAQARHLLQRLIALSLIVLLMLTVSFYIIARQIVRPLETLQARMLNIVNGQLEACPRERYMLKDLQSMAEALRVFRITAVRRERMTRERLSLHAQIAEAHRNLQADMNAAAKVQLAQMPAPGMVGPFRFATFFAPSNTLAGDTFDYGVLPGSRVGLFQVDVAGHGAAAGLVSVAAHIGARRALRGVKPGGGLAAAVGMLNAFWNPEMTYFTLLAVEFDTSADRARLVQAGHPHPVLIRRDGSITRLGNGGLPIGVVSDATFEEVEFEFGIGDRLVVFTDGIYENTNASGETFSEERFVAALKHNAGCSTDELMREIRSGFQTWNGTATLSDDVSLVVAERV